jgi:mannose-1-phosphate guanylyltransferase
MRHIDKVATFVRRQPERMVLIGAQADTAETEYGWIEPGETLGQVGAMPRTLIERQRARHVPDSAGLSSWESGSSKYTAQRAGHKPRGPSWRAVL